MLASGLHLVEDRGYAFPADLRRGGETKSPTGRTVRLDFRLTVWSIDPVKHIGWVVWRCADHVAPALADYPPDSVRPTGANLARRAHPLDHDVGAVDVCLRGSSATHNLSITLMELQVLK